MTVCLTQIIECICLHGIDSNRMVHHPTQNKQSQQADWGSPCSDREDSQPRHWGTPKKTKSYTENGDRL